MSISSLWGPFMGSRSMGLYKQPGSDNWYVEFEMKGVGALLGTRGDRVRQSTGTTKEKDARAFEAKLRADYKKRIESGFSKMTLLEAMERYGNTVIKQGTSNGKNY